MLLGLGGLGVPTVARAQEAGCEPWAPEAFEGLASDAQDALLDDDADRVLRVAQSIRAQVPCLSGPVPSAPLGRLLYALSLVAYARDEAWDPLVTAALLADPSLERPYGPPVLQGYALPDDLVTTTWTAQGALWVDGRPVDGPVALVGPHVVQVERDGVWTSAWVEDGEVPDGLLDAPAPEVLPEPVSSATSPLTTSSSALSLRVHLALGAHLGAGPAVATSVGEQPAVRVSLPVEVGLALEPRGGFVRVAGSFTPQLTGPWVYEVDGVVKASRLGGGAHLAGGGRIGIGHIGALAGIHVPGRLTFQAIGGVEAVSSVGLRFEARMGLHYTTGQRVEPAADLAIVLTPRVWSR